MNIFKKADGKMKNFNRELESNNSNLEFLH